MHKGTNEAPWKDAAVIDGLMSKRGHAGLDRNGSPYRKTVCPRTGVGNSWTVLAIRGADYLGGSRMACRFRQLYDRASAICVLTGYLRGLVSLLPTPFVLVVGLLQRAA